MKELLLFMVIFFFSFKAEAQGNLMITPKRVVFEGNKQKEVLNLINMGSETTTYSVSFVQKSMKEDGSFVDITDSEPGQPFADPYLRIFPRQITLAPNEGQSIVLQYRRKAEMLAGEYRSHLYFRSEKDYTALRNNSQKKDSKSVSVQLIPIYGMSIPIIIRTGETDLTVTLSNLKLQTLDDKSNVLSFTINRIGNISLYGDILVQFIPKKGETYDIGAVNGLGVYTSINKRNISLQLDTVEGKSLAKGKISVTYSSNDDSKAVILAVADLVIE
jgi:hypothetical protein